jgi:glycine/D-amino acid oxidase-like deaminating enzyme
VGGGVIGLLSAVECVLAGHEVVLVEKDDLPPPHATSSDHHRILRALHVGDLTTTVAMLSTHRRWIELERMLATRFYNRVGSLTALRGDDLADGVSLLWHSGAPGRVLRAEDLERDYPHVMFPAGTSAVLERNAGVLLAGRVLAACLAWLRSQPDVVLHAGREVVRVDASAPALHLADGEVLGADAVIVAPGPWSRALVPDRAAARLTLLRQSVLYCRVPTDDLARWAATPAIPVLGTPEGVWLVPPVVGTPLKVSAASACRAVDGVEDHRTPASWREHLTALAANAVRGFTADWVTEARDCYYLERTGTGGRGTIALAEKVVVFAACGGGSFKSAPLIARSLVRRISEPAPDDVEFGDLEPRSTVFDPC